jgi:hypothetical protein
VPKLGENSETAIWDLPETHFQKNPMPFDASGAVVVGTVSAGQSYLSNDRRNIYSEFKLKLQEIIKASNAPYLRVADLMTFNAKAGRSGFRPAKYRPERPWRNRCRRSETATSFF